MNSDDNTPSKEMCDELGVGNVTLCKDLIKRNYS